MIYNNKPVHRKKSNSKKKIMRKRSKFKKIVILLFVIFIEASILVGIMFKINSKPAKNDVINTYQPVEAEKTTSKPKFTVFIDPGHGFSDSGTESIAESGFDINESEFTLDMSLELEKILIKKGIDVVLSRRTNYDDRQKDEFIKLNSEERVQLAHNSNSDIFISLHIDAMDKKVRNYDTVNGYNIYYCDNGVKKDNGTKQLAEYVKSGFVKSTNLEKVTLKTMEDEEAFYVIKHTTMPSVLFELGYCTNAQDASRLIDKNWRDIAVRGIANGIIEYFDSL